RMTDNQMKPGLAASRKGAVSMGSSEERPAPLRATSTLTRRAINPILRIRLRARLCDDVQHLRQLAARGNAGDAQGGPRGWQAPLQSRQPRRDARCLHALQTTRLRTGRRYRQ